MVLAGAAEDVDVPLHIDANDASARVWAVGGVPFPAGAVHDVRELTLLHEVTPMPCQITRLATWPDGSVEWALVEAEVSRTQHLHLRRGPRAPIAQPLTAVLHEGQATVTAPWGRLVLGGTGAGGAFLSELAFGSVRVIDPRTPGRLQLRTVRAPGPGALPPDSAWFHNAGSTAQAAALTITETAIEEQGPLQVVIRLRGLFQAPHWGETLPPKATVGDPPGVIPWSLRVSVTASGRIEFAHQLIYTGEPDHDFITDWGILLPGMRGVGWSCPEPAPVTRVADGAYPPTVCVAGDWGTAIALDGWERRPSGFTFEDAQCELACWPAWAGPLDVRRYARTWSAGESGNTKDAAAMARFAQVAARGMALSRRFLVLPWVPTMVPSTGSPDATQALLVAEPSWYAHSGACGAWAAPTKSSAPLEDLIERRIDYHLFCQDLFGWYGALVYGYWQSRYGQAHRIDRWDNDYGRWGWDLGDGGGRVGQLLLQEFLRTGIRRYFDAGAAYCRICYDTTLVHTRMHLENAGGWWIAQGMSHRHNVQPYGCPYIGLRGSYPGGQRLLYFLTGDGIIRDGLELVAEASAAAAAGQTQRLGDSGDGDGQGAAATALLWRAEATGSAQDLQACKAIVLSTHVLPPAKPAAVGYAGAFGLYEAATMLAERTHDADLQARLVQSARVLASATAATGTLQLLAQAVAWTRDPQLTAALHAAVADIEAHAHDGLEDLPRSTWPGHAGWRTPAMDANQLRALPWAMAALLPAAAPWHAPAMPLTLPAHPPQGWYQPGGVAPVEVPAVAALTSQGTRATQAGPLAVATGPIRWSADGGGAVAVQAPALASQPLQWWADLVDDQAAAHVRRVVATSWRCAGMGSSLVLRAATDGLTWTVALHPTTSEGVPVVQVDASLQGTVRIAAWGVTIPCAVGTDPHRRRVTIPGRFRLERCREDQNDERLPNWLTAEYHWGEGAPLWPRWSLAGLDIEAGGYRIWKTSGLDTAPVTCDQGIEGANWLDWTDSSLAVPAGLTVRVVPAADTAASLRCELPTGTIEVQVVRVGPGDELPAEPALRGTVLLAPHDGYRPPFSRPDLTRAQYDALIADLSYGENQGLAALRFARAITHKVPGNHWLADLRDLGIEPHEILAQMQWGDGLATHCQRLGVRWDPSDVEGSIQRILDHYRQRAAP